MIYLLLAICASSSIALIFKYSETRGLNRYAVTTVNYVAACAVSLVIMLLDPVWPGETITASAFLGEFGAILQGSAARLSDAGSLWWAVLLGLVAGAFFFLSFIYYQISVKNQGVGLAGAFAKLGILVPMSLSLVVWREFPNSIQWVGMGLAVSAIVIVNWPGSRQLADSLKPALLLLFLFGGLAEFSNKFYQKYALTDFKEYFLLTTFAVAFVWSLVATFRHAKPVSRRDMLIGIAVGIPNLFSSFFLILALESIPAAVAYSAFGAGTILVINVVGVTFFGERLSYRDKWAIALISIALILINL